MALIIPFKDKTPQIHPTAWVAPNAVVIGDVVIEAEASIWFSCVLRGDMGKIHIGRRTNIQDFSMIHMTEHMSHTIVGEECVIGHRVTLHGCKIGNGVLVGMGATILDNATVGDGSIIGAGSLLTARKTIEPGQMAIGQPCRVKRALMEPEMQATRIGAQHYVDVSRHYLEAGHV